MAHRYWREFICLLLAAASSFVTGQTSARDDSSRPHEVVGYFTEWGASGGRYTVKTLAESGAAAELTQLDYAFGRVSDNRCHIANAQAAVQHAYTASTSVDGSNDPTEANRLRGTFHQLQELKRRFPRLKVLISLGGWGQSGGFSSAAQPEHLRAFVQSCIAMFIQGHFVSGLVEPGIFDGVDLDWEYPVGGGVQPGRPEDKQNSTALAREFRKQLDAIRPGLLLTAALPAEEEYYTNFELQEIGRYLDYISIMAYDLHWNSDPLTNFHSALFHDPADPSLPPLDKRYGDYAVRGFLQAGVPAQKLIFGVPFYGKGWSGVSQTNHGLYQKASGPAQSGGSYRELKALPTDAERKYYAEAVTCTLWSRGNFWSYDCPESLNAKMAYIKAHRLGGVMFWELSQDTPDLELLHILAGAK